MSHRFWEIVEGLFFEVYQQAFRMQQNSHGEADDDIFKAATEVT